MLRGLVVTNRDPFHLFAHQTLTWHMLAVDRLPLCLSDLVDQLGELRVVDVLAEVNIMELLVLAEFRDPRPKPG